MLDVRRTNVEEARIVRQAFRMIADDLRCALYPTPPDLSGLDTMSSNMDAYAQSAMSAAGLSGDPSSLLGGAGGQGGQSSQSSQSGQSQGGQSQGGRTSPSGQSPQAGQRAGGQGNQATGEAGTQEDPAAAETATSVVGLVGTLNELRFDISRLPRVDQYQSLMEDGELTATDIPSDVKTVVYFVQDEGAAATGGLPTPATTGRGRGLMRAELDRAVSAWQEMNGDFESSYTGAKLLAEEVVGLEFQYFDGETWTETWDSSEMGGLPMAVEVFLTLQPTVAMTEDEIAQFSGTSDELLPEEQTYRLVIRLPTAISAATRALEAEAAEIAAAEILPSEPSGTQAAGSGTGGTGNTGGGQSGGGNTGGGNTGGGFGGGIGGGGIGSGGGPGTDGGGRGGRGGRGGDAAGGRGGDSGGGRAGRGGGNPGGGIGGGRPGGGSGAPRGGGRGR
jgi:hypothetical protein